MSAQATERHGAALPQPPAHLPGLLPGLLPDGYALTATDGLLVEGQPRPGVPRRLSDLVEAAPADGSPTSVYLADLPAARAALRQGTDPLLYHAWRDVLPPRDLTAHPGATAGDPTGDPGGRWYADLVMYAAGTLPGGELIRSTGHWNTPAQLEIFQALTGRVLLLTTTRSTGRPSVRYQVLGPGELAVVPFGAWHVTYALDGPAAVFNLYTDDPAVPQAHPSRAAAQRTALKYHSHQPVEIAAVRTATSFCFVSSAWTRRGWGLPKAAPDHAWLREHIEHSLARFYLDAPAAALVRLLHTARSNPDLASNALTRPGLATASALTRHSAALSSSSAEPHDTMSNPGLPEATRTRPTTAGDHHQTICFAQADAAVRLTCGSSAAFRHATTTLYAYQVRPALPTTAWRVAIVVGPVSHPDMIELASFGASPLEIGPQLHAHIVPLPDGEMYWVPAHATAIRVDRTDWAITVYCPDEDSAVYWTARLVRQAMTAQLLATGAVYAHAAALSLNGHGILITGPRGAGKTTTMIAALRHLGGDYVTNDRLLLRSEGGAVVGYPWPIHLRAGIGTLLAFPDLTDLVPERLRAVPAQQRWHHPEKVRIQPPDFPRLLRGGTIATQCRPGLMLWPELRPGRQRADTDPVSAHEVLEVLLRTRLFMHDPTAGVSSRINHWLLPNPPQQEAISHLHAVVRTLAATVPCYRISGGDPDAIARRVAELLEEHAI